MTAKRWVVLFFAGTFRVLGVLFMATPVLSANVWLAGIGQPLQSWISIVGFFGVFVAVGYGLFYVGSKMLEKSYSPPRY